MSRSVKKGPYVEAKLMSRILAMNEANEKKVIKTWSRASTIFPDFVGFVHRLNSAQKLRFDVRSFLNAS